MACLKLATICIGAAPVESDSQRLAIDKGFRSQESSSRVDSLEWRYKDVFTVECEVVAIYAGVWSNLVFVVLSPVATKGCRHGLLTIEGTCVNRRYEKPCLTRFSALLLRLKIIPTSCKLFDRTQTLFTVE